MQKQKKIVQDLIRHTTLNGRRPALAGFLGGDALHVERLLETGRAEFPAQQLKTTFNFWLDLPKVEGVADTEKIDPNDLVPALGYLALVDVEEDDDYRYALFGSKIARVSGIDMTGKTLSNFETTDDVKTFVWACYQVAGELRQPLYTIHQAPPEITVSQWHRVILPLGRGGQITRFLVCSVPITEDGQVR